MCGPGREPNVTRTTFPSFLSFLVFQFCCWAGFARPGLTCENQSGYVERLGLGFPSPAESRSLCARSEPIRQRIPPAAASSPFLFAPRLLQATPLTRKPSVQTAFAKRTRTIRTSDGRMAGRTDGRIHHNQVVRARRPLMAPCASRWVQLTRFDTPAPEAQCAPLLRHTKPLTELALRRTWDSSTDQFPSCNDTRVGVPPPHLVAPRSNSFGFLALAIH